MASHSRYISPREFGSLMAELRLTPNMFNDTLLQYLERHRIIVPIARVCWPVALVIEDRGGTPESILTQQERDEARALSNALRLWNRFDAAPESVHPLDCGEHAPGARLITLNIEDQQFVPWDDFRVNVNPPEEAPRYAEGAVDTYYHAWQVLLVADALEMGMRIIFDTRKTEFFDIALYGDFEKLSSVEVFRSTSLTAPHELNEGLRWTPFFDASARLETVRTRMLIAMSRDREDGRLSEIEAENLSATLDLAAQDIFAAIGATRQQIRDYVAYLCQRWDDWRRRGRIELANEYKRHIAFAVRAAMYVLNLDFAAFASEVGQATRYDGESLDEIFPDWMRKAREDLELSLKHRVVALAPPADPNLTLDDSSIPDFLDWLERKDQWKLHLAVEAILARQFSTSGVDHAALAKEVEALSATFEHLLNTLLDEAGVTPPSALMKKMQRFWDAVPEVSNVLKAHWSLASTKPGTPRNLQLANIEALPLNGLNAGVARLLLTAILYRNDGLHNAMTNWPESELHEVTRIFLTASMFCRRNLLTNPPS